MKTDREMLELAAKAQGWVDYPEDSVEQGAYWHTDAARAPFGPRITKATWNPLTNDGDALRLAVAVCLPIDITDEETTVRALNVVERHGINPYAATRRAIVRAAAAIGESL